MIEELNWDSLAIRRKASRLSTFQRVYNNEDCPHDLSSRLTMAPDERLRHVHAFRLQSITCRKNVGQYSFIPRSIREWNALPQNILNQQVMDNPALFRSTFLSRS